MQCVILIGIQATGKSSFFKERFADTHVRVNLDMLRTRKRERKLVEVCFEARIPFVVDNTNVTSSDRSVYISLAKERSVPVAGYYFSSRVADALRRNGQRQGAARIPDAGVLGTSARLDLPSVEEGFDELFYVTLDKNGFTVSEWKNEI